MSARAAVVSAVFLVASAAAVAQEPTVPCKGAPKVVGECFSVRGRLSVHNGIPIRIWIVGTHRMLAVTNATRNGVTLLPEIERLLSLGDPMEIVVFGDYEVCPLSKQHPGWMQFVCLESAAHLATRRRDG